MVNLRRQWREDARLCLMAIPIISLVLNALSWLRFGIDLPLLDDWRVYLQRTATSLTVKDLFTPANDTLYPVGIALDALAQRYLNGNSVAYQFVSMTGLLGLLLWIQWRLLSSALKDKFLAACAFSLTIFMLQPGSYWGMQNLAYHQGLPVLGILVAVAVVLRQRWDPRWGVPTVLVLGLLSGLAYISGAFCSVVTALVLLGFAAFRKTSYRRQLSQGGGALLAAGCLTVAAQLWVIIGYQKGQIHASGTPWALPTEADFWLFLLGKIGRSLALPSAQPLVSLTIVAGILAVTSGLALGLLILYARGDYRRLLDSRPCIVFVTVFVTVFAYLGLLSAGRANLRPETISKPLEIFSFGFANFYHFFWVTLLWPWAAAAIFTIADRWRRLHFLRSSAFVLMLSLTTVLYAMPSGVFSHSAFYRSTAAHRLDTQIECLRAALDSGRGIECPALYPSDLTGAFQYARSIGASFTRYFAPKPVPLGTDVPAPVFRLSTAPAEAVTFRNVLSYKRTQDGVEIEAGLDPILIVAVPANSLARCVQLQVSLLVRARNSDAVQVFFLAKGQSVYTERASTVKAYPGRESDYALVALEANSARGFEDRLRIDPGRHTQHFTIREIEVRCQIEGVVE
jgi:hypothetical protein